MMKDKRTGYHHSLSLPSFFVGDDRKDNTFMRNREKERRKGAPS
jgi:hypothetical protein